MIGTLCNRAIVLALLPVRMRLAEHRIWRLRAPLSTPPPDAPARTDVTVSIRHGAIAGVGKHLHIPRDIETISCQGCLVLAGFRNAHVHFMEPKWNDAVEAACG
jgi:imidazolonepropionase-like amidohydrolase